MAYDIAQGAAGAASGAATGFAIGGPVGGVIGGAIGLFSGRKKKAKKISTLDKNQKQLYQQKMDALYGKGPLAGLYNFDSEAANKNFDATVARPAYRQFTENVIPGITGQYRKGNLMNSSYSAEALSRAGRDVQENLDAQRSNMQFLGSQAALERKGNSIDNLLNMQTFAYNQPGTSSIDNILNSVAEAGGKYVSNYLDSKQSTPKVAEPAPNPNAQAV